MKVDLCLGEKPPAPFCEPYGRLFELVEDDLIGVGMVNPFVPRHLDHLVEAGHGCPKVFKFKSSWPPRALVIGKQKRTMIGEG